jgi:outer membrane lipoprotein-sorting protein
MTRISLPGLLVLCLALSLTLAGRPASAAAWGLDQLMTALAHGANGTATFTERKYLAVVDIPIDSSGELRFIPPDRLEKHTLKPSPETMLLDGDTLTLERGSRKQVLQLQDYPGISGMIGSIRATLAGDRKALEKVYRLKLDGTAERWSLLLTPRDAKVAQVVREIHIEGRRDEVRSIEIQQAGGDRSVMTIRKAGAS